jgi:hypothetical protein
MRQDLQLHDDLRFDQRRNSRGSLTLDNYNSRRV